MFRSLGAEAVIEGGQTMNPSTEDIVKAIQDLSADHVFVLPNNKNIFMAAEQAAELVDVPVTALETRTVLQGLTALIAFDPEAEAERNREKMEEALKGVLCGEVTYAVRDSQVNGHSIKEGDFLGIFEGKIETVGAESYRHLQGSSAEDVSPRRRFGDHPVRERRDRCPGEGIVRFSGAKLPGCGARSITEGSRCTSF